MRIYIEYIIQEGRVANHKPGFAHICYNVSSPEHLKEVEEFIIHHKMGYPLTVLEKSGSKECGFIKFYYIKNHGVIELNIPLKGYGYFYNHTTIAQRALDQGHGV